MKGVTNKIKTRKKKAGYLSDSYIKRLIGPIAKLELIIVKCYAR
jgi:hypothetical protein